MKLSDAQGKAVRVVLNNGDAYEGIGYDYTSALDNEPDPASITVDHIELFEPEIKSVEMIEPPA